jgi:hypothetical protein
MTKPVTLEEATSLGFDRMWNLYGEQLLAAHAADHLHSNGSPVEHTKAMLREPIRQDLERLNKGLSLLFEQKWDDAHE